MFLLLTTTQISQSPSFRLYLFKHGVTWSRGFLKNRQELKQKHADSNIPEHALVHDVDIRWELTFENASRLLEQQQAVCGVLAEDSNIWHLMP